MGITTDGKFSNKSLRQVVITNNREFTETMTITLDQHTCPRCFGGIPNDLQRGQYIGALSRTDNKTYICSDCGTAEGLEDYFDLGCMSQAEWRVNQS